MARTPVQTEIANQARQVFRARWGRLLADLPVNLMEWADQFQAHVLRIRVDDPRFHGAAAKQPASGVVLLINRTDDFRVQRFTLAHELGHVWLGHHQHARTYWWFETEANAVASEILLPQAYLERWVRPTIPVDPADHARWWSAMGPALARRAALTESVVAYHLQDLGWLSLPEENPPETAVGRSHPSPAFAESVLQLGGTPAPHPH